jgi:hypothetical protein
VRVLIGCEESGEVRRAFRARGHDTWSCDLIPAADGSEHHAEGNGEVKATCLWLRNLRKLVPTTPNEPGRHPACWLMSPGPNRARDRSRTYPGIAAAFAEQWG